MVMEGTNMKLRQAKFQMDYLDGKFDGFTADDTWNGWGCPYFTFEQAQAYLAAHNKTVGGADGCKPAFYDADSDAFVFPMDEYDDRYDATVIDGQKLYPIGAYGWCWWMDSE
jgi:hypothetical protein